MDFKELGTQIAKESMSQEGLHHKRLEIQKFAEKTSETKIEILEPDYEKQSNILVNCNYYIDLIEKLIR